MPSRCVELFIGHVIILMDVDFVLSSRQKKLYGGGCFSYLVNLHFEQHTSLVAVLNYSVDM